MSWRGRHDIFDVVVFLGEVTWIVEEKENKEGLDAGWRFDIG